MAYGYEYLFKESSVPKNLIIQFDNGDVFNNDKIFSESLELTEAICSSEQLTFGNIESNCFKVTLSDTLQSHKNQWFNAYIVLNNNNKTKFQFGRYCVAEDKAIGDHTRRNITAYDMLYTIVSSDVSAWYKALTFPITLKSFRKSFCALFGVSQVSTVLVNDSMLIERTIEPEQLTGGDVLRSYCEINGVFPNINRSGKLEYITLPNESSLYELVPKNDLYPDNNLFPQEANAQHIYRSLYRSCTYDEFTTHKISKLQIRQEEYDVGAFSGTGDNCYIVEDNFLVYGKNADELNSIADNMFNLISTYAPYRPYEVMTVGNPCVNIGEGIRISTRYEIVISFILKRTLRGINSLKDTYSAKGVETYNEIVNDVRTSIVQLKGKTNVLTRTVDETKSELTEKINDTATNITESYTSAIEQTAQSITSTLESEITDSVTNATNTLSSQIIQTATDIKAWVEGNNTNPDDNSQLSKNHAELKLSYDTFSSKIKSDLYTDSKLTTTKVSELKQTVDGIYSDVYVKNDKGKYVSRIQQNANEISLKVSENDVCSVISQKSDEISIQGNRFVLSADNCTISADGTITASNVDLSGKISASEGSIGGFTITDSAIYNGKTELNPYDFDNVQGVYIGTDGINIGTKDNYIKATANGVIDLKGTNFSLSNDGLVIKDSTFNDEGVMIKNKNSLLSLKDDTLTLQPKTTEKDKYMSISSNSLYMGFSDSNYFSVSSTNLKFTSNNSSLEMMPSELRISYSKYYTKYISIDTDGISAYNQSITLNTSGNNSVKIGTNTNRIGFFGNDGALKQTVSNLTSTPTVDNLKTTLNNLIDALQSYNLIG